jgi:hypothetical protein
VRPADDIFGCEHGILLPGMPGKGGRGMECTCSINPGSTCEFEELLSQKMKTSKTTHKCGECSREIPPGEKYELCRGEFDGDIYRYKTCLDCLSFRNNFFDDWCFENLWEDFENAMDECGWQVPEKCLSKVTPVTRAKICEMIEAEWYRLENPKYNKSTCPKPDTWFAEGGKCGWAWCCDDCADNPDRGSD